VEIPPAVRQNLGITFAKVENRPVSRTLRLPGHFELLPTATREYRAMSRGRVELLVQHQSRVAPNQPLYRLETPRLRELQQELAAADAGTRSAKAAVESIPRLFEAHERHHREIEAAIGLWKARVEQLTQLNAAGGGRAEELANARASLNQAQTDFAETLEKEAELVVRKSEAESQLAAARRRFELFLAAAASLTGESPEILRKEDVAAGAPRWQSMSNIEIRAAAAGVVETFGTTNGAWADESQNILTVIAPDQLRFRAKGFQRDLDRLSEGQSAQIVFPAGDQAARAPPMKGTLRIAPRGDVESRTIDLFCTPDGIAPWARAGVAGFLEVTIAGTGANELAIPLSCVVRDGLTPIIFRRDPNAPDRVIRMPADLGLDDGRWIVIASGVKEGDEVVLDGAYQLLVATSGTIQKGGHFHPDGTFHEGDQ
jgi:multidrug efflux pump subunit AcrA (membrane-fusion protein)